ncbi:hypothetical protein [Parashewanella tropica]|uniref:hypothetical protein n=1 Tax=Parashewanella tropica TaxID=2547970 RepID=UPI00105A12DE|nr:hypothetical protein [Parashewanella tropica]
MNTLSKALCLTFSIFTIPFVSASSTLPLQQSISPFYKINAPTKVNANNFSTPDLPKTGYGLCQVAHLSSDCYVIKNASTNTIELVWENHTPLTLPPESQNGMVVLSDPHLVQKHATHIVVTNTQSKAEIYNGDIKDMVGLSCSETTCKDWN